MKILSLLVFSLATITSCNLHPVKNLPEVKKSIRVVQFFSDSSFWNLPLDKTIEIDPRSDYWIHLLANDPSCKNIGINLYNYTIPIYKVDSSFSYRLVKEVYTNEPGTVPFRQYPEFRNKPIPLPANLQPSPGSDMHLAVIDVAKNIAWDMFYVKKDSLGEWESYTGISYPLNGTGVFDRSLFDIKLNESVHQYGPGRAAGVPIIAGTIMYDEVLAGKIRHKLSCAFRFVGYHEFVSPPAIWTDGNFDGGIPEGAIIQLDPSLDLSQFSLWPGELVVARALQEYGAVVVDFAGGNTLYAEGLWYDSARSWKGILRDWDGGIVSIPVKYFHVIKCKNIIKGGDRKKDFFKKLLDEKKNCKGQTS